ncbi:hypothetical protein [Pseudonocardia sp. H11422]|uniref:hypothetical protein n=1 Tax=Pseudonocardia sp. H11422 TaxID=2835866 RepID=UPI001BDC9728|nr:hypothetical protein [Pseudonocardia sp. H11422]
MRAVRYGALTGAALLAVCALVGALCLAGHLDARARASGLGARSIGELVIAPDGGTGVRWAPSAGSERTDPLDLEGTVPPTGTRVEVAYDPADPARLVVPGSAVLVDGDRDGAGLGFVAAVAAGTLLVAGWQLLSRRRVLSRPGRAASVHRVRIQHGLLTRSWLELDDGRCVPVHPDPVLAGLPSPATVLLHGDPTRNRLVGATVAGVGLAPAGRVLRTAPGGRRFDGPSTPDPDREADAARRLRLWSRLRVDTAQVVPAPVIGAVWVFVVGGGFGGFLAATAVTAAAGLFRAAVRGSDPS